MRPLVSAQAREETEFELALKLLKLQSTRYYVATAQKYNNQCLN